MHLVEMVAPDLELCLDIMRECIIIVHKTVVGMSVVQIDGCPLTMQLITGNS
jgi:hypothetical protein